MNEFDDWNQTEILVKHLLMTQPGLIFSAATTPDGKTVGSTTFAAARNGESPERPRAMAFAKRSS